MNIMKYIAYVVAALFVVLGIAILSGWFIQSNFPSQFRITVGIVLILYGVFRIVATYYKKAEKPE